LVRTCVLGSSSESKPTKMENPKLAYQKLGGGLDTMPACITNGTEIQLSLELAVNMERSDNAHVSQVVELLEGMPLTPRTTATIALFLAAMVR